jgi:hypothetical protein
MLFSPHDDRAALLVELADAHVHNVSAALKVCMGQVDKAVSLFLSFAWQGSVVAPRLCVKADTERRAWRALLNMQEAIRET